MGCGPNHHFISLHNMGVKKTKHSFFCFRQAVHRSRAFLNFFTFFSFFLSCLFFWSCIDPLKPESSSGKNLPRVKRALKELHHQRVAKKAASELKTAYLSTLGWRRYLVGLLIIGDTIKKVESPQAPPPDSLWVLACVLEKEALPLLKKAREKAISSGASDTFVAASLEIAHLSNAPKILLEGALVSDITGHYFKRTRELAKEYGCKDLASNILPLARAGTNAFPVHLKSNLKILQNMGLSLGSLSPMLFSSIWRLAVFMGCSDFAPIVSKKLQNPSTLPLSTFVILSQAAAHLPSSTGLKQLAVFSLSGEKDSSKDLEPNSKSHNSDRLIKKALAISAFGWTPSPLKENSSLIATHLHISNDENKAKKSTYPEFSFFVRSLVLSINRIGEPKELPLLQEMKEKLPKSLQPLLIKVEKTLFAIKGIGNKKELIQLSKNGSIYERERALLELGRNKSLLEENDVIKNIAGHPYLKQALHTASRWQNMPD